MTAPAPYLAAAFQMPAWSVAQAADVAGARAGMLAAIRGLARDLGEAKGFLETFKGLPLKLVVLPEYAFSGFASGAADFVARAAWAMDGPEYAALGELAARFGLFIGGNSYELDPHFPGLHFQASWLVDPAGAVVLRYRRLNSLYTPTPHDVWTEYRRHYGMEAVLPVADTAIGRVAAIASEEILYPELARALALRGAELFIHSSSEQGGMVATPKQVARRARAFENLAWLVSANTAGIAGMGIAGMAADGNSAVVDHRGMVLAEALSGKNVNAFAEIDLAASRHARGSPGMTNLLARQRLELWAESYQGTVFPPNTLMWDGKPRAPERGEQRETLARVIAARRAKGLL